MAYERVLSPGDEYLLELRDRKVLWLIPLVAVGYFLWLIYVLSSTDPPIFETSVWVWVGTGLFVIFVAFEALLLVRTRTKPVVYPMGGGARDETQGGVPPPKGHVRQDYDVATWPPEHREGLFVNHHVRIDEDLVLKFRQEIEEEWIR